VTGQARWLHKVAADLAITEERLLAAILTSTIRAGVLKA
jgi:hypothetical protein